MADAPPTMASHNTFVLATRRHTTRLPRSIPSPRRQRPGAPGPAISLVGHVDVERVWGHVVRCATTCASPTIATGRDLPTSIWFLPTGEARDCRGPACCRHEPSRTWRTSSAARWVGNESPTRRLADHRSVG
jgi:hypothetical protein